MADEDKESKKRNRRLVSAIFLACLFIGLGVGLALGEVAIGVLVGLGVGFLASGIVGWRIGSR
ncbi:hypothetical protein ES703_19223 [subsurface metagenome]